MQLSLSYQFHGVQAITQWIFKLYLQNYQVFLVGPPLKHCFLRGSYNWNSFYRSPLVVQFESTKFEPNYQPIKIVRYSNMIGEINLDSFVRKPYCDWLKSISRLGCIYCIVTLFLMNKTRPFASCCLYLPATSPEEL